MPEEAIREQLQQIEKVAKALEQIAESLDEPESRRDLQRLVRSLRSFIGVGESVARLSGLRAKTKAHSAK